MEHPLPKIIQFGREVCNDLVQAERREWWLANGLGGYAAGTIAGTLTRRYHGLLITPLVRGQAPVLVFAKADATLMLGDTAYPLHCNRWRGDIVHPRGYLQLEAFHLEGGLPVWRYVIDGLRLEARIWMEPGANTTCLAWRLISELDEDEHPRLRVRLLVNARNHHGQSLPDEFNLAVDASDCELRILLPQGPTLRFRSRCGRFSTESTWYEHFELSEEGARGLPNEDNHLCIGEVDLPLYSGEWVGFLASLEENPSPYLGELLRQRQRQESGLLRQLKTKSACLADAPAWIDQLVLAAHGFLVEQPAATGSSGAAIIAGYPWFGEWGRDTFIALPGLMLATHRFEAGRRILDRWSDHLQAGLLPNRLPDDGTPIEYNSADAPLWFIEAWYAYVEASRDLTALARHYPALTAILAAYKVGTDHGIAMDPVDGLIRAGAPESQLTWMDARVDSRPVTPRAGKPVELNALWYNALCRISEFAVLLDEDAEPFRHMAELTREGFQRYVRDDGAGLHDVLDGPDGDDSRLRPNQILAVSLAHSPLAPDRQGAVLRVVGSRLHTSYGLRTLDPADPGYRPRHAGTAPARDAAYHQGPAWTWLLGHYALAVFRVSGNAEHAQSLLEPIADHLRDAGLGTVSELFDAEPPFTPRGTPSQAWSVACVLEAWCRLQQARHPCRSSSHG